MSKKRSQRMKPLDLKSKPPSKAAESTFSTQQAEDGWAWMLDDGLGSVRGVVDNGSNILQTMTYDSYGNRIIANGPDQSMYGYTGEPTDLNELVYLRDRYYSPNLGTFTSQDTFEGSMNDPMSLNGYAYAHGNPVNRTDPSGHFPLPINQQINTMMQSNPLGFVQMMNSGMCYGQTQTCPNPPFCTNTPQPTLTPSPTAIQNSCAPTPTLVPTPSGTPLPSVTPVPFNAARIQSLSPTDLELIALNIYYEARDYPEHWGAIANVWFNRLADPYATSTNLQRLLVDNSSDWDIFVAGFTRRDGTRLNPLMLEATDIDIIQANYAAYANSTNRPDTVVANARNGYPNPGYQGMLAFFHINDEDAGRRICQMECVAAYPGPSVAANLARRGNLRVISVAGSRRLIMNNGIFFPTVSLNANNPCVTCCARNNP